ncbi:hypothetical protein DERF_014805 [Dermatophagoides farinae]|uniref:Uncharacterized protein n=1 Tax=Dermatophagoides farinae TaxID=6954 RepID=A0A922HPY1_DERFA|nr:hypothetical protein DERF_014805 [Dermatophagoides farinae]
MMIISRQRPINLVVDDDMYSTTRMKMSCQNHNDDNATDRYIQQQQQLVKILFRLYNIIMNYVLISNRHFLKSDSNIDDDDDDDDYDAVHN